MSDSKPVSVVFVCWGNICRSPIAERVAEKLAADRGLTGVQFSSAATSREELGAPMDERAARVLGRHGYRTGGHRAHQITRDEIERADLVLAMEDIHVRKMLAHRPRRDQSPTADRLRPRRRTRQRDRRPVVRARRPASNVRSPLSRPPIPGVLDTVAELIEERDQARADVRADVGPTHEAPRAGAAGRSPAGRHRLWTRRAAAAGQHVLEADGLGRVVASAGEPDHDRAVRGGHAERVGGDQQLQRDVRQRDRRQSGRSSSDR